MAVPSYTQSQETGGMMLEGRKQPRTTKRFLLQICAVHDPRLEELTLGENLSPCGARVAAARSWEPGCHVDVTSHTGESRGRARVVYCSSVGDRKFIVGLNFITQANRLEATEKVL
jgi:hypothetical protein